MADRASNFKNAGKTADQNRGKRREFAIELRKFKKQDQVLRYFVADLLLSRGWSATIG